MSRMEFILHAAGKASTVAFDVRRLINAGYTGRDQAAVRHHIEELRAHGVPAPARTPTMYAKPATLLTQGPTIEVLDGHTSGEAEFVLLIGGGRVLVAAGSDHTDRELEKASIEKAKMMCPNVIGREAWDLAEVRDGWDEIVLRGYATAGGRRVLYQEAPLARMMTPEDLMDLAKRRTDEDLEGLALFSGTVGMMGGQILFGDRFEVELMDARRGRTLRCDYRIAPLAYLKDG
jgi:hypothetical protein